MISYLKGKYIDRTEEGNIILNVNGIGFEVSVTGEVLGRVAYNNTDEIELFTYMQVKEDGMALFGFSTLDELSIFKKIISVSGIGPKGGMSIEGSEPDLTLPGSDLSDMLDYLRETNKY